MRVLLSNYARRHFDAIAATPREECRQQSRLRASTASGVTPRRIDSLSHTPPRIHKDSPRAAAFAAARRMAP